MIPKGWEMDMKPRHETHRLPIVVSMEGENGSE